MDTDVTIVGMGPTGALLGILLAQHDIKTAIVERDATAYSRPRAVQLDHEVLRLLNLAGVANEVQAASQPVKGYEFVSAKGELLMGFYPESELAPTGYAWNNLFHASTCRNVLCNTGTMHGPTCSMQVQVGISYWYDAWTNLLHAVSPNPVISKS